MKLTLDTIKYITVFENLTGAQIKDCINNTNGLTFLVEEGNMQRALKGKKRVENAIKKEITLISYSDDVLKFVRNLIYPVKAQIHQQESKIIITPEQVTDRGKIFGRGRERLEFILTLVQRYFSITEIIVQ